MPARNYRQKTTGQKVKGVTTILSLLDKPALIWWGYKQGMDNFDRLMGQIAEFAKRPDLDGFSRELGEMIQNFKQTTLYDKRDRAADAGTLAHTMVEHHLQGMDVPDTKGMDKAVVEKAEGCFLTFLDWHKANQIKVLASEVELTSERLPYGGTIDHVIISALTPQDRVDILDIKTGKDIYLEAKLQVRAYKPLWEEHHPNAMVAGFHIVRLGPTGEFTHKYFPSLDDKYFEIFTSLLNVSETLNILGEKL